MDEWGERVGGGRGEGGGGGGSDKLLQCRYEMLYFVSQEYSNVTLSKANLNIQCGFTLGQICIV